MPLPIWKRIVCNQRLPGDLHDCIEPVRSRDPGQHVRRTGRPHLQHQQGSNSSAGENRHDQHGHGAYRFEQVFAKRDSEAHQTYLVFVQTAKRNAAILLAHPPEPAATHPVQNTQQDILQRYGWQGEA